MAITDGAGLPVALHVDSASPHEVTLVQKTIQGRFVAKLPERIIGDKTYYSDPLDAELTAVGVGRIAPHKANRKRLKTQDSRNIGIAY